MPSPLKQGGALVSAGLPVYNGETFIARALDSLLAQDYPWLEVIVSDNASTDRTIEIVQAYADKDPRVRVHRQTSNQGVQKNFEKTLELARGAYFFWAGVDDLWMPSFVSELVAELEAYPKAQLGMCAFDRVWEDGRLHDTKRFEGTSSPNGRSALGNLLNTTSPLKYNLFLYGLFRTPFIRRAVRYFPEIPAWDRVFMCMISLSAPIRYVDKVLHRHGLNSKPLMQRYPDEQVFKKKDGGAHRFLFVKTLSSICFTTLRSDTVPMHRKLYLVPGAAHYSWEVFKHRSRGFVKKKLKPAQWKKLKRWKVFVSKT